MSLWCNGDYVMVPHSFWWHHPLWPVRDSCCVDSDSQKESPQKLSEQPHSTLHPYLPPSCPVPAPTHATCIYTGDIAFSIDCPYTCIHWVYLSTFCTHVHVCLLPIYYVYIYMIVHCIYIVHTCTWRIYEACIIVHLHAHVHAHVHAHS